MEEVQYLLESVLQGFYWLDTVSFFFSFLLWFKIV